MSLPGVRRLPHLSLLAVAALLCARTAHAGKHDLSLLNLCPQQQVTLGGVPQQECEWVAQQRDGNGVITGPIAPSGEAQSMYRSLMSEMGVAIAPRLMTPADTLGYAGFQFSADVGVTKINSDQAYWDGVRGVNPSNRTAIRPNSYLTTVGGFVRKGLWLPLPAFEFGAGALKVVDSNMYAVQGYAKLALQEGFHGWALPSFAVRGSASQLLGTSEVDLVVFGVDVLASKAFSIGGTARIEPFLGWNMLFIDARSGVIDATPACDAVAVQNAAVGGPAASGHCAPAQNGGGVAGAGPQWNDLNANFTFPGQDIITRQRWFGGFKLKLSVLFVAAQVAIVPAGSSRDDRQAAGAADRSKLQQAYSLSAGFDF
jgi:hypothetical protein